MLNPFTDTENCPLCHSPASSLLSPKFFICSLCMGIFCSQKHLPHYEIEKAHYEKHNNDINDIRYKNFVSPIISSVTSEYKPGAVGLDFGSGTGSVIVKCLDNLGFTIFEYDPFFKNNANVLNEKYNFITCCEVIEHFHNPEKEFLLMKSLINFGHIYCMTHLYTIDINFESWYYKNDPTHVFFYQKSTIEWITHRFGFSSFEINNRLIVFKI